MPIQFKCPHCSRSMKVHDSLGGSKGTCPFCRKVVEVPIGELLEETPAPKPVARAPVAVDPLSFTSPSAGRAAAPAFQEFADDSGDSEPSPLLAARAQRRKQKRIIGGVLGALAATAAIWIAYFMFQDKIPTLAGAKSTETAKATRSADFVIVEDKKIETPKKTVAASTKRPMPEKIDDTPKSEEPKEPKKSTTEPPKPAEDEKPKPTTDEKPRPAVPVVTVREEATDAEPEKISVMPEPVLATADTEKRAANKLEQARELLFEGKRDEGMEYLRDIVTKWPNTKAGGTAKDLLESLKRRKDP